LGLWGDWGFNTTSPLSEGLSLSSCRHQVPDGPLNEQDDDDADDDDSDYMPGEDDDDSVNEQDNDKDE
jgi:hypothetical protein